MQRARSSRVMAVGALALALGAVPGFGPALLPGSLGPNDSNSMATAAAESAPLLPPPPPGTPRPDTFPPDRPATAPPPSDAPVPRGRPPAVAAADLSVALHAGPSPARAGDTITVFASVANAGAHAAPGVTLTGRVTGDVRVAAEAEGGGCRVADQVVTCSLGNVAAGESAVRAVSLRAPRAGTLRIVMDVAAVEARDADPDMGNNTAVAEVEVSAAR